MVREGRTQRGDGMDTDHKRPLIRGGTNDPDNLRVIDKNINRSFPRDRKARMK